MEAIKKPIKMIGAVKHNRACVKKLISYGVDSRELLRQMHHQGHKELLAIDRGAEQSQNGHSFLLHQLILLCLHLCDVFGGVILAFEPLQRYGIQKVSQSLNVVQCLALIAPGQNQ